MKHFVPYVKVYMIELSAILYLVHRASLLIFPGAPMRDLGKEVTVGDGEVYATTAFF